MSNLNEWRIYISHDKILLSNDLGFRVELNIPSPGNIVTITLNEHTYHFGIYPSNYPSSPSTSTYMSQSDQPSSDPSMSPNGDGGFENPIQL